MPPPPLSRLELIAIRDGNLRNADVRRLLHEIRRLRVIAVIAQQYVDCVDSRSECTDLVRHGLVERLKVEPCIQEIEDNRQAMREELDKAGG